MTEQLPPPPPDEPAGDAGDQASRLQMAEEQEAIRAALAGRVHGTDALEDRGVAIAPLEGPDVLDGDAVEASDDPVHAGGMPVTDLGEARPDLEASVDIALSMTGLGEDGAAMALEEGSSVSGDAPPDADELDEATGAATDPGLDAELGPVDPTAAEDLDALVDTVPPTHDPDDPEDPDGYGVPPAPDTADLGEPPDG